LSYQDVLEAAWKQHLAPRAADAPTVISTFAGCGGSSLGYSMAGFRELLAVEWDDNAAATFRLNFPDVPVYHGDISKLTVEDVLARTGLQPGELDVFDGSPPCQGFSTAGKRDFGDDRNQLFREYVRLLRGLKPKVFVMENVSGMVKGKMKLIFANILRELKASGYRVSARLMNAMYFNVPQSRERMIFIGVREDLGIEPSHPKGQARPLGVSDALVACVPRTFTGDVVAKNKVYRSATTRRSLTAPFGTLSGRMNRHGIHPTETRYFSIEEIQRAGSFPDQFRFTGTPTDKTMRIGNSVPPLFMRAIAEHIRHMILSRISLAEAA
jgi:DNA (cytosine-5)-methyltransferase 1